MKGKYQSSKAFENLRKRAEKILELQDFKAGAGAEQDLMRLLYEVEVQQVELELQNEELRNSNQELENSRNEFAELYQSAPVAMIKLSEKGIIEQINDAATQLFSSFKKFHLGRAFSSLVFPEDQRTYFSIFNKFALNRTSAFCELRLSSSQDQLVYVQINAKAKPISEKKIQWHLALVDITDRKKYEAALRESELRFRLALRSTLVSVAAQDCDLRYIWAYNQRTARPEEIVGRFDDEIFTAGDAARITAIKRRVLAENVVVREQMWFDRPAGRIFLDICWEPIHDESGRVAGVASATVDLTQIKLAEMALKSSLAEKEVLLKEIHHRVKNNMQVISSLLALQASESKDATTRDALQEVTNRVRSMAMVHEKLYQSADLSRVEFADYTQSLLEHLWQAQATTASGIRLELDLQPILLPINVAIPCGLILNELVANALKHAFNGRDNGRVTVSLRTGEKGGVCLSVRDNGIGLPPGFEWREAKSLGLRLVQMLARQLHASVDVTGEKETQFAVNFERSNP